MHNKHKILFCIDSPGFGGSEANALKVIDILSVRYSVKLLLNANLPPEVVSIFKQRGLEYHFYFSDNNARKILPGLIKGLKIARQYKDHLFIVWSHHINSNRWLQLVLAITNQRFVVVEQLLPTNYVEFGKVSKLTMPIKRIVAKKALSTVICAYSQVENYVFAMKTQNITAIPNTRPVNAIANAANNARTESMTQGNKITICCIGRLCAQKSQETLLRAVALIRNEKIEVVLVGEGEDKAFLQQLISELNISDIIFPGFVSDTIQFLGAADIFVLPSLDEGLPGALIEAMAAGVPSIATDIPGNNELIIDKETGILVPVKDPHALASALREYINNPELSKRYSAKAFEHVTRNYDDKINETLWVDLMDGFYKEYK